MLISGRLAASEQEQMQHIQATSASNVPSIKSSFRTRRSIEMISYE